MLRDELPATPPRARRSAAESKERILEAAEESFAAKGFDGARLGVIARRAGVQQALIHHYFVDKHGLYREVIVRALDGMTVESLGILQRLGEMAPAALPRGGLRITPKEVEAIVDAFVTVLQRFYAGHGAIVSILRYEAQQPGSPVLDLFIAKIKPIFDAVVAVVDGMSERGELRHGLDARNLCLSAVAMVGAPFQEEPLLRAVWPVDVRSATFLEARRREVVATLLSRILP